MASAHMHNHNFAEHSSLNRILARQMECEKQFKSNACGCQFSVVPSTSFPPRPQNGTISPTHAGNNDNRNELPIVLQADTGIHVFRLATNFSLEMRQNQQRMYRRATVFDTASTSV